MKTHRWINDPIFAVYFLDKVCFKVDEKPFISTVTTEQFKLLKDMKMLGSVTDDRSTSYLLTLAKHDDPDIQEYFKNVSGRFAVREYKLQEFAEAYYRFRYANPANDALTDFIHTVHAMLYYVSDASSMATLFAKLEKSNLVN